MKKFTFLRAAKSASLLLFVALIAVSCDNSTSSEEEEHADAEGFYLELDGAKIVDQLPGGTLTGEIEMEPDTESNLITIWFYDDDGDAFQPDEPEFTLGFEADDQGIVEFEQHADDGTWSFHLHAEDIEDHTEIRFMLMHNDHSDFTTQDIHVHVEFED